MVGGVAAKRAVMQACEQLWEEEIEFLRDLVRHKGVRGDTNHVQHFVAAALRTTGFEVVETGIDVQEIAHLPGFSPPEWSYDGLINVVGTAIGSGKGGRSLLMNGHVDVVSPEPVEHWTVDPWGGEIRDNRMYGRGSADMKAGVAAMIYAVRALKAAGIQLRGDVLVQTVIDEECTGNGTLSCLAHGYVADAAIIPEPTDLKLVAAHPGVLWCRIEVRGVGAHASGASAAVNAAEKAFVVVQGLRDLEEQWNRPEELHPAFSMIAHPINFNIGTFHAGDWPSTVPELAVLEVRLSYNPGQQVDDVQNVVREAVTRAALADPWLRHHEPTVTFFGFRAEPAIYDTDSDLARIVAANSGKAGDGRLQTIPFTATIDNRFFENYYGIPNVCYGPLGGQLHAPDEWVDLESVRACTRTLAGTLIDWCEVE